MLDSVLSSLSSERQTVIDLQTLMVSHPALAPENGGQGEVEKAAALKAQLEDYGFPKPLEIHAPDPRVACGYRPSLAYLFPGQDPSRTFWVLAHIDVVPEGDRSLWKTDPFKLTVDGDFLYGRGVEDNHQGGISGMLLGKALVEQKVMPPINYGLLLLADEEAGNTYGIEYVVKNHADLFKKDDLFLVPDHGSPEGNSIEVAEKSILWLRIAVDGKQCHASMPQLGINAFQAAADFVVRLKRLYSLFEREDPLFMPPRSTFEATKHEANVPNVNTIPGRDVFYLDCRVLPSYDLRDVTDAIEKIGEEIVGDYGVSVSYEPVHACQAAPSTSPEAEIVRRLKTALRDEKGCEARIEGVGGGTFAAVIRREGHPAAAWASILENPHEPNEKGRISAAIGDARVMARALLG